MITNVLRFSSVPVAPAARAELQIAFGSEVHITSTDERLPASPMAAVEKFDEIAFGAKVCLLYTSPSPRD